MRLVKMYTHQPYRSLSMPYRASQETTRATPMFTFLCEMDIACTYAGRNKTRALAYQAAQFAHDAALEARRPDLAWQANELMGALNHA